MLTHRYHIVLSYAIVPICCTTSVVLTSIRSMRVLRQQILRRGGGFSGHGERPFHLHPPSNTISYVERHRSSSFTRTAMTAPSPRFRNQRPTSNGHQTHPPPAATEADASPKSPPAPSEPRTINSGMVSTGKHVRGLVTRKPDQQSRSEAGGRLDNFQGWRLRVGQKERSGATVPRGGGV